MEEIRGVRVSNGSLIAAADPLLCLVTVCRQAAGLLFDASLEPWSGSAVKKNLNALTHCPPSLSRLSWSQLRSPEIAPLSKGPHNAVPDSPALFCFRFACRLASGRHVFVDSPRPWARSDAEKNHIESTHCFPIQSFLDRLRLLGSQRVLEPEGGKAPLLHKDSEQDRTQIFIRTLSGKSICKQMWTGEMIKNIKEEIQADTGIPSNLLVLVHAGKILQENFSLQHYGIGRDSTITISTWLRGGSSGAGQKGFQGSTSKPTVSYRDAAKGKAPSTGKEPAKSNPLPGQYIVEQTPENPSISLDSPEVNCIFTDLQNKAVICRFNGFWPKTEALYQWIHTVWTTDCQIHLCSKGFFIVTFHEGEERDKILQEGP